MHGLRQPAHVVQVPLPLLGQPALPQPVVEGPRLLQLPLALQQQRPRNAQRAARDGAGGRQRGSGDGAGGRERCAGDCARGVHARREHVRAVQVRFFWPAFVVIFVFPTRSLAVKDSFLIKSPVFSQKGGKTTPLKRTARSA